MDNKMETRKVSVYTVDGYEEIDSEYDAIKLTKDMPVKGVISWSLAHGMQLTDIKGVKVSGFPFGFNNEELLKRIRITDLPDYIQITGKIAAFVQRYYMGLVELKGYYARKSTWQMQPKP
jgi:uncharacterized Zn ribbon protein